MKELTLKGMKKEENKLALKVGAEYAIGRFFKGIGGETTAVFAGVDMGICTGAIAAALIPGGSEAKDVLQILGTATAGILGYKYTYNFTKKMFDEVADLILEKVSEHCEEAKALRAEIDELQNTLPEDEEVEVVE